jgi:hypothetical protein
MAKAIVFIIITIIIFTSCHKECDWPYKDVNYPLRDSNVNWLKGLPTDTIITATSNKGRALSYRLVPRLEFEGFGAGDDCAVYHGQEHFLRYTSSIYDYNFNILIYRHWEKDKFLLCDPYKASYHMSGYQAEIILSDYNNKITIEAKNRSGYGINKLDGTFSRMDSLTVGNKKYFDVFKIDFVDKKYSLDEKIKFFYVDLKKGVIRFDTFDGEIWSLNF